MINFKILLIGYLLLACFIVRSTNGKPQIKHSESFYAKLKERFELDPTSLTHGELIILALKPASSQTSVSKKTVSALTPNRPPLCTIS